MNGTGKKVIVKLIGEDGNAFSIIGRVMHAMKRANWSKDEIDEYKRQATSGDYDNLLAVTYEYVDEPYEIETDCDCTERFTR